MQSLKPKFIVEIRATTHDAYGNLIQSRPWTPANSLLNQFVQLLIILMSQVTATVKDVGGTDRAIAAHTTDLKCNAPNANILYGILIGTGTTEVAMDDNCLETQLSANIAHAVQTFAVENPDANTWRAATSRGLTNNTGATINVTEVALYTNYVAGSYFCIDRTLYPVAVAAGATLTLTYRITVTL